MSIAKAYARELREETSYSATWFPNVPVAVGDVGRLRNNEWTRMTTLEKLGIPFSVDEGTAADYSYASKGDVKFSSGANGSTSGATSPVGKAEGSLHIEFRREGAVVFETSGSRSRRMTDSHSVGQKIIERFHAGQWEPDYVVVTEVIAATRAVVLVSSGRGGAVDLAANTSVAPALGDLAKLGADLKLESAENMSVRILGGEPLTPLFKASRVKDRWFKNVSFDDVKTRSISVDDVLVRTDYDDLDE